MSFFEVAFQIPTAPSLYLSIKRYHLYNKKCMLLKDSNFSLEWML